MEEGWLCVEGCAVLELGRQSGVLKSGGKKNASYSNENDGAFTPGGEQTSSFYGSSGTAARFFMQFGEDNLIEPVQETNVQILRGDCVEEMRAMPENAVDSVVCDPPYGLEFMGKDWDKLWAKRDKSEDLSGKSSSPFLAAQVDKYVGGKKAQAWHEAWAREALRVLRPGGYLLAFGGTRTVHRLACAIEDAGFEIRDRYLNIGGDAAESMPGEIAWVYGSGFPKSANIEKLMTKAQGQKRRAHGMVPLAGPQSAQMHAGLGSAVKPAYEPVVVARKPLSEKNLVKNILKHGEWLEDGTVYKVGTGGLQIDASRVNGVKPERGNTGNGKEGIFGMGSRSPVEPTGAGRFPSNLLLSHVPGPNGCQRVGSRRVKGSRIEKPCTSGDMQSGYGGALNGHRGARGHGDPDGLEEVPEYICAEGCAVRALDEQSGVRKSGERKASRRKDEQRTNGWGMSTNGNESSEGGASRFFVNFSPDPNPGFFYTSKASKKDRSANGAVENGHPTCKPTTLMRYLLKLVTPPGGTTLDPFAGSGTTGVAALSEGFNAILIEQDEEYCEIAERRIFYHSLPEAERVEIPTPKQVKARNTYGFKTTQTVRHCAKHGDSIPSGVNAYGCGCPLVYRKDEAKTAKEWGLENVHPQDTPLRYNPDERPEEGGTFEPVEEPWEDKRTGPEPDDLTYREVIEKFATALAKTEEQFKDKLF